VLMCWFVRAVAYLRGDGDRWIWNNDGMMISRKKLRNSENISCSSTSLSTVNVAWSHLGLKPEFHDWKPVPNHLSYGTPKGTECFSKFLLVGIYITKIWKLSEMKSQFYFIIMSVISVDIISAFSEFENTFEVWPF
jgi:hypothetical protein